MATRKVFAQYEEIIDLNTVGGTISVIGIHTPTGDTPRKMFPGFFQQYKKYKYLGCSVVGANAAQLPVDPLGVGYEAGEGNENVMDPRDAFDPIMFHGCHGQDLGTILNKLYAGNTALQDLTDSLSGWIEDNSNDADNGRAELLEGLYYKALTDMTWKKFGIQSGFRLKGLHPLIYSLATNHQISPSALGGGVQIVDGVPTVQGGYFDMDSSDTSVPSALDWQLFTPRCQKLGWLDTRVPYAGSFEEVGEGSYNNWMNGVQSAINYAELPKIFMGVLLLPMSRRVQQFLRIVIKHRFVFAGFRGASFDGNMLGSPSMFHMGFNNFGPTDSNDDHMKGEDGSGDDVIPPDDTLGGASFTLKNNVTRGQGFSFLDGVYDMYSTLEFDGTDYVLQSMTTGASRASFSSTDYDLYFMIKQGDSDSAILGVYVVGKSGTDYAAKRRVVYNTKIYGSENSGSSYSEFDNTFSFILDPESSIGDDLGTATPYDVVIG